jgi:hypothetical protein
VLQVICNFAGVPLVVPRLHAGVVSDISIFREDKPDLQPTELGMGDKGYYGDQDVEPPHKKPKGGSLTEEQIAQNIVHSCVLLFLSVLSFGQVVARLSSTAYGSTRNFRSWAVRVLLVVRLLTASFAGTFRGKVWHDSDPLQACVTIITRIVQMQTLLVISRFVCLLLLTIVFAVTSSQAHRAARS